jgi:predicted DNA-binding transcriptional regulator AlpA
MKEWMTQDDLCQYLQAPEALIFELIEKNQIPYHIKLGQPRFFRKEIDEWMLSDSDEKVKSEEEMNMYVYRDRPIKDYVLTATKILIGPTAWNRFPGFLVKLSEMLNKVDRKYLLRKDIESMIDNFNDYLRVACQLGLLDNIRSGRFTHYYPHDNLLSISANTPEDEIKEKIKDCVYDVVRQRKEEIPQEHHAIYLLWYLLKLKENGINLDESYFNKGGEENTFPMIRMNFTKGLCNFLFDGNQGDELDFLNKWVELL